MRLIDADELLIAMSTWDKFGYDEQERLIPIGNDDERYVPYVHYADMVKAVNGMPTIDARAEAIAEYKSKLETDVTARAQNCYKTMFNEREQEIFNFATKTFLDAMDYFARQMKEQKKEND